MTTVGYALRRLGVSVLLLLLLTFLTFSLYKAIPANPAGFLVDMQKATPDQIAKAEAALHLHDPFYKQYGDYSGGWSTAISGSRTRDDSDARRLTRRHAGRRGGGSRRTGDRGARDRRGAACSVDLDSPRRDRRREATVGDRPNDPGGLAGRDLHASTRRRTAAAAVPRQPLGHRPRARLLPVLRHRRRAGEFDGFSLSQDLGCAGPTAWASHLILPWITFALFFVAIYTRLVRVRRSR